MAERIKMGLVGCGGMSGAHMGGYRNLWEKGIRDYDIVAACDIELERAEERANQAHEFQGGTKPAVYTELDEDAGETSGVGMRGHLRVAQRAPHPRRAGIGCREACHY